MESFDAPAAEAPALLPAALVEASLAARPTRTPGDQPRAAVLLVEIDMQGLAA